MSFAIERSAVSSNYRGGRGLPNTTWGVLDDDSAGTREVYFGHG